MPRPIRVQYPGAWHHVMNRGACHQAVFLDHYDRRRFLALTALASKRFSTEIHAYCLMGNHIHLLIRTPDKSLDRTMQLLLGKYTQYFNRRHDRDGALFRGRYKSILIEGDAYMLAVSRYIHRNPTAILGSAFADYPWSSYRSFTGDQPTPSWLHTGFTLDLVHGRKRYEGFVSTPFQSDVDKIYERARLPTSIGSTDTGPSSGSR